MKKTKRNTAIASSVLFTVLAFSAFGLKVNQSENIANTEENIKNISQSKKRDEKQTKSDTSSFVYEDFVVGGTSSAIVAEIDNVDHIFMWGNNNQGQLGVGKYNKLPIVDDGAIFDGGDKVANLMGEGNVDNLPTPEDVNVDGGAAGIQGSVKAIRMAQDATLVAIENELGFIDVYSSGLDYYGMLGQGNDTVTQEEAKTWPYSPKFIKVNFEDEVGEILKFKSDDDFVLSTTTKNAYVAGNTNNGQYKVYSWGVNNMGQLGNGTAGSGKDSAGSERASDPRTENLSYSAKPIDITNNFDLPTYNDGIPTVDYDTQEIWYDKDGSIDTIDRWEGATGKGETDWTTSPETSKYVYPFETEKVNSTKGWKLNEVVGAASVVYIFENDAGQKALALSGSVGSKVTGALAHEFVTKEDASAWENTSGSLLPATFYWDGMDIPTFLSPDPDTASGDYSKLEDKYGDKETEFISLSSTIYGFEFSFRIWNEDKTSFEDHSFYTGRQNPTSSNSSKNYLPDLNARYIFSEGISNQKSATGEVQLGYSDVEIVSSAAAKDTQFILIKTPDRISSGQFVYSIVSFGENRGGIVDPTRGIPEIEHDVSTSSTIIKESVISFTTAKSYDQIGTPDLDPSFFTKDDFNSLESYGRTLPGVRVPNPEFGVNETIKDEYITLEEYFGTDLDKYEWEIKNIAFGLMHGTFTLTNGLEISDPEYFEKSFYFGSNESKQISSTLPEKDVLTPISFKLASSPLTDSFTLNTATTQSDGIDFSIKIVHGGEIEHFTPEVDTTTEDNTVRFYADLNYDGETDTATEEIGTGLTVGSQPTGTIEYIGRGETPVGGSSNAPEYDKTDISLADQSRSTYSETYNFRIKGLNPGVVFSDLRVSVNNHNPIKVDGTLKTLQKFKFTDDPTHIELLETATDLFSIKTELMYDVPGYGMIQDEDITLDEKYIEDNTIVYFEDELGNSYSTDKTKTGSTYEVSLKATDLGTPGSENPANDSLEVGETAYGQPVTLQVFGPDLTPDTAYNNFKFYIADEGTTSIWDAGSEKDFSSMTLIEETILVNTTKLAEISSKTKVEYDATANEAKFALNIKSGAYTNLTGDVENYSLIDPSGVTLTTDTYNVIDGDATKATEELEATMTLDATSPESKAELVVEGVKDNQYYENVNVSAFDNSSTPKEVTQTLDGSWTTGAKEIEVISSTASTDTDLVTPTSAGVDVTIKDSSFDKEYETYDFTTTPTVTATGSDGTTSFTAEYISTDTTGTEGNVYTYKISSFGPVESITDFDLTFNSDGVEKTIKVNTTITSQPKSIKAGELKVLDKDQDSVTYSMSATKGDEDWDKYEDILWEETTLVADVVDANGNKETKTFESKDVKVTKGPTKEDNKEYIEFEIPLSSNASIKPTSFAIHGSIHGTQTGSGIDESMTDALEAEIDTSSIALGEITNNSIEITGVNTLSNFTNKQYASIANIEATLKGGVNTVDNSVKADDVKVNITSPTSDSNTLLFEGLEANTTYSELVINITDDLDGYSDDTATVSLTDATTYSNSLTEDDFVEGDLTVDQDKNSARYKYTVKDSIHTENINLEDFALNGKDAGILLTAVPNDSDVSQPMALRNVESTATYNQVSGELIVDITGLMNNVTYDITSLYFMDEDNEAAANPKFIDLNPTEDITIEPIDFIEEDITISNIEMDMGTYLDSSLTINLEDIKYGGDTEAFDINLLTEFKDKDGNSYTVTNIDYSEPSIALNGSKTISNIVIEITPIEDIAGKKITIDTFMYGGEEFKMNTPFTYQTYRLFDPATDTYVYGSNASEIMDADTQLTLDLGTPPRNGIEYYGVEFTTAIINGIEYNLTPATNRDKGTYIVEGFVPEDGVSYSLENVNGSSLDSKNDLGTIEFDEVPEPPVEPEVPEDDGKGFPWWIIILITILTLGIGGIIIFFLLKSKDEKIEDIKEDIDYSKMTVAQLKEEATNRGIDFDKSAKKADLIELLQGK